VGQKAAKSKKKKTALPNLMKKGERVKVAKTKGKRLAYLRGISPDNRNPKRPKMHAQTERNIWGIQRPL